MKILVIIPAYNEEKSIVNVIEKLKKDYPLADYIVINDCSTDDTLTVMKEHQYNYLDLPINLGIGGGVQSGYRYAYENHYDIAIQIDGDGQHDTGYLSRVIEPLQNNEADIVIGSRFIDKQGFQSSVMRRIGIRFLSDLIYLCCGTRVHDATSGFRGVNRTYIEAYARQYPQDYPEPEAIVESSLQGARIMEVPVVMKERENGSSSIHAWRSVYYMIKVSLAIILCRLSNKRRRKQ
ncbi:MAG: glycosyltransferase family 2 protein [Lachnospiraceae bacterium]